MKKIIRGLLAAAAAMTPVMVQADVANKTFLADRGTISNNCLLSMSACAKKEHNKDAIGADLSVTGFYRQSHNKTKMAKYFGGGTDAAPAGNIEVAAGTTATTALNSSDIQLATAADAATIDGVVGLSPRRIEAGAHIQWNQCLNKFVKGLWMSVAAPVVYVRTEMRPDFTVSTPDAAGKTLADFFTGANVTPAAYELATQAPLANQKLTTAYNSTTGVADVKAAVGYKFVQEKDYSFGGSIHALIPTGNKNAGDVAFEATYGNRSFFFGAGLDGQFNLYRSEDKTSSFDMHACAKYSYGFGAEQVRTLGLTNDANGDYAQGQYRTVAKIGTYSVSPLANVSTLAVTVEPRSRLEAVAGFCYRFNRFSVDAAYNLFYAQAETVKAKAAWDETLYARTTAVVADANVDEAGEEFATNNSTRGGLILSNGVTTNGNSVTLAAATTPSQVIHGVGAGVGYSFETKMPIRIGGGADVNFSSNNHSVNSWTVWAKLGFSF